MSLVLATKLKPRAIFDAANRDHRKWVSKYIKTQSWRDCPVTFIVDDNSPNMAFVLQRQLVEYYSNREFGEL